MVDDIKTAFKNSWELFILRSVWEWFLFFLILAVAGIHILTHPFTKESYKTFRGYGMSPLVALALTLMGWKHSIFFSSYQRYFKPRK